MKDRLLDTAIDHFGQSGFEGAATRAIARDANTAMSSITYHFGGKEGLYLACADYIAGNIAERLDPLIERLTRDELHDRDGAVAAVSFVLGGFARMMLDPSSAPWARFIAREQQAPTAAFERLYEGAMKRVIDTVVELVERARPDLSSAQVRATAITLWGQAIVLRMGRASVCRIMQVDEVDPATADLLVERLLANARCILSAEPETAQ